MPYVIEDNVVKSTSIATASRESVIPENIITKGMLSSISAADQCFINQRFSGKLQAFLIGYVGQITNGDGILVTNLHE